MDIFTVTEEKIRFYERVRDVSSLKKNLLLCYGVEAKYYLLKEENFEFDFNYCDFKVSEDKTNIHFLCQEDVKSIIQDKISWAKLTDEELSTYYTEEEMQQINIAKQKWSREHCIAYERMMNTDIADPIGDEDEVPPEDFPDIERKLIDIEILKVEKIIVRTVEVELCEI